MTTSDEYIDVRATEGAVVGLPLVTPEVVRTDGKPDHFSYPSGASPWVVRVGEYTIFGGGLHNKQQCEDYAAGFTYGRSQYVRRRTD